MILQIITSPLQLLILDYNYILLNGLYWIKRVFESVLSRLKLNTVLGRSHSFIVTSSESELNWKNIVAAEFSRTTDRKTEDATHFAVFFAATASSCLTISLVNKGSRCNAGEEQRVSCICNAKDIGCVIRSAKKNTRRCYKPISRSLMKSWVYLELDESVDNVYKATRTHAPQ